MRRHVTTALTVLSGLALALAAMFMVGPAAAASVTPEVVAGNPSCEDLGYSYGFKPQKPGGGDATTSGTYSDGYVTIDLTVSSSPTSVSWDSNGFGIDVVIVKGGPSANVYSYDPEATSDSGLTTPTNSSGGPAGLSHIEFCYDFEVVVEKTADTSFIRTYNWTITKDADDTYDLFTGDSATHEYTISVEKTGYTDSDWSVSGSISIENPAPVAATITGVSDIVSPDIAATVSCGVTFPYSLAVNGTLVCTYSTDLPDGSDRVNTATVTTSGAVGGGSGTADVTFGAPTSEVNATINVSDDNGTASTADDLSFGPFGDTASVSYTRTFDCDADEGSHVNTATIVETGDSDTATVTVNCYELVVTKDADEALTRTWTWTIDKSADQTSLTLSPGQLFTVNYEVEVDATSADGDWMVSGSISVDNPAPIDATINSVSDIVSPAIIADVDCDVTFPYTLAAEDTLECTYSAALPDAGDRTNTATATLQNYDYAADGSATADGTSDFSGTANVKFDSPAVSEVDECVDVSDTNTGVLGTVCADDAPKTFSYALTFGQSPDADVELVCGPNTHVNTASFVTSDSGATGDDNWTVNATVQCLAGCTLTQGYWKTHSHRGPAPYDDAWLNIGPLGADQSFFLSGKTYYQVLWTPPAGNAYYILAHQYIAAKLNILNGASTTPDVTAAITWAESFFNTYTPTTSLSKSLANTVKQKAGILDKYNNGLVGPGHCSE